MPIYEAAPTREIEVGKGVDIRYLLRGDGHWVVQDAQGAIYKVDETTDRVTTILEFHAGAINALNASPIDHFAASTGEDGTVRLWDYVENKCLYHSKFATAGVSMDWAPSTIDSATRTIAVGFASGVVRVLIRAAEEWKVASVFKPHNDRVVSTAYAPDGKSLATAGADGIVFFLKIQPASTAGSPATYDPIGFFNIGHPIIDLSWREDSAAVLLTSTAGGVLELASPMSVADIDTSESYELKQLGTREFSFTPKPTMATEVESAEASTEADADGRSGSPFEAKAPAPPKILRAVYANGETERMYLCVDGDHGSEIHECEFGAEYSMDEYPSHCHDHFPREVAVARPAVNWSKGRPCARAMPRQRER